MLVALDTSTSYASIALARGEQLVAELSWDVGRRHSQQLLDRLAWLLQSSGSAPADLSAIAVARGPGSFNGVRVAVTVAKSLAFALGLPVFACSTLDILAWGCASAGARGSLVTLLEAGRGEVYAARYIATPAPPAAHADQAERCGPGVWRVAEPEVVAPAALAASIQDPQDTALVCGEWRPETRRALEAALGERVRFAAGVGGRRASWLVALALDRRARGLTDDPATLEPLYLRRPAITVSARQIAIDAAPPHPDGRFVDAEEGDARALHR
jgi:tRNA threonylcarbamoyladenosine biosynthesis protein TsaB